MAQRAHWRGSGGDLLLAIAVALVMAAAWSARAWPMLSALHLPDTDDVMRLQQIRDWLAGQAFDDLSQHRLGAQGLAMHWSRLPDLVPAAIIYKLAPLMGTARAELVAVILWPTLLFAAALFLVASIARRIDPGSARTAVIVAAIGYPATTLFLPGRIDHHGFQVVLLLVIVRALMAGAGRASGAIVAVAACSSIVIGLETAPLLATAGVVIWLGWARGGDCGRMLAFGLTFGLLLGFASIVFSGAAWTFPACDSFTRRAWIVAQSVGFAPVLLGLAGRAMPSPRHRIAVSGLVALALAALLAPVAKGCLAPYGGVDPLLAQLWLAQVAEAQPLLAAAWADAIGYAGVMAVGLVASLWCWNRRPGQTGWGLILLFQLTALAIAFAQLRGAYVGAILAAPGLAAVIGMARRLGTPWLAGAWLGSAGIVYPIAAQALPMIPSLDQGVGQHAAVARRASGPACTAPQVMQRIAALPRGTIIAPLDFGAYAIAATPHRLIAAPYHRNNAGNLASYRFFLSTPARSRAIAQIVEADYVVFCASAFAELGRGITDDRRRLIGLLRAGGHPSWLRPIGQVPDGALIFAIEPRLSQAPFAR